LIKPIAPNTISPFVEPPLGAQHPRGVFVPSGRAAKIFCRLGKADGDASQLGSSTFPELQVPTAQRARDQFDIKTLTPQEWENRKAIETLIAQ
jgi:hypothetical protein